MEQVLASHQDAAWLPAGGRAEVVLAGRHSAVPSPTCLARVLATRGAKILTVQRPDGKGLDIPTLRVGDGLVEDCLHALLARTLGCVPRTTLLGYVHNVVSDPPDEYPWPAPDAYFVVWHCHVPPTSGADGVWLDGAEAEVHLRDRHWWPLAKHAPR